MTPICKRALATLGLSLALLASSPWTARADVIPSCGPGQSWQRHPSPPALRGHSGACEYDLAQLFGGAGCCIAALLLLGQWLVLRRGPTSHRGTSSREP